MSSALGLSLEDDLLNFYSDSPKELTNFESTIITVTTATTIVHSLSICYKQLHVVSYWTEWFFHWTGTSAV